MPINNSTIIGAPDDTGGILKRLAPSVTVDNIFSFQDSAGVKWQRIIDGEYRASYLNIAGPSDKAPLLQTAISDARVRTLVINKDLVINSLLSFPAGKVLKFEDGAVINGTGTISGAIIDASYEKQIFVSTINLTSAKSATGKWSVRWSGAVGNGSLDDYLAISRINGVASSSTHKTVLFPGSTGNYICNTSINIPTGVTWEFESGATINGTATLTFGSMWRGPETRLFGDTINIGWVNNGTDSLADGVVINAKHFGLIGNNIADDTIPMNRATAALPGAGGTVETKGYVKFNPSGLKAITDTKNTTNFNIYGNWNITDELVQTGKLNLYGKGGGLANVQFNNGNLAAIGYSGPSNKSVIVQIGAGPAGRIEDIGIYMGDAKYGVYINGVTNVNQFACARKYFKNVGIVNVNPNSGGTPVRWEHAIWCYFDNCAFINSDITKPTIEIITTQATLPPGKFDITQTGLGHMKNIVLSGRGIYIGATADTGQFIGNIEFDDIILENAEGPVFELDSRFIDVALLFIRRCEYADERISPKPALIQNTGLRTRDITLRNCHYPNETPIQGDKINYLDYEGAPPYGNIARYVEKMDFTSRGSVHGYSDHVDPNKGFIQGVTNSPFVKALNVDLLPSQSSPFITPDKKAPDGSNSAFLATVLTGFVQVNIDFISRPSGFNLAQGDFIFFGGWVKNADPTKSAGLDAGRGARIGINYSNGTVTRQVDAAGSRPVIAVNYGWIFQSYVYEAPEAISNGQFRLYLNVIENYPIYYWKPFCFIIPKTSGTREEIIGWAKQLTEGSSFSEVSESTLSFTSSTNLSGLLKIDSKDGRQKHNYGIYKPIKVLENTIIFDDFNRANSTTSLGGPATPYDTFSWTNQTAGIIGINSNRAIYQSGSSNPIATINTGLADYTIRSKFNAVTATHAGFVLRYTDTNNYVFVRFINFADVNPGVAIFNNVGGTITQVALVHKNFIVGTYDVEISIAGNLVSVTVSGGDSPVAFVRGTISSSLGTTNTIAGILSFPFGGIYSDGGSSWDDFTILKSNDFSGSTPAIIGVDQYGNTYRALTDTEDDQF